MHASVAEEVDAVVRHATAEIAETEPRERQERFWTEYANPFGVPRSNFATEVWTGKATVLAAVTAGVSKNTGTTARFDGIVQALGLPRLGFRSEGDQ